MQGGYYYPIYRGYEVSIVAYIMYESLLDCKPVSAKLKHVQNRYDSRDMSPSIVARSLLSEDQLIDTKFVRITGDEFENDVSTMIILSKDSASLSKTSVLNLIPLSSSFWS